MLTNDHVAHADGQGEAQVREFARAWYIAGGRDAEARERREAYWDSGRAAEGGDASIAAEYAEKAVHFAAALRAAPVQLQEPESVWNAFHRAWTAAVGTSQYDKSVWLAASAQLSHAGLLAAAPPAQAVPGERERALEAECERFRGLADENDGYAKMHAAEVNELRAELAAVLDRDTVARERERYFRWYSETEEKAQQDRFHFAESLRELEDEIRRLRAENGRLDTALFETETAALSSPTSTPSTEEAPDA